MKVFHQVEGCFNKWGEDQFKHPVNWDFIGTVVFFETDPPEFIMINGVVYSKEQ